MRTTITINDALPRELRRRAAAVRRPFREVVETTLACGLAAQSKPSRSRAFRVRPHALGLKPGFRGISLNQLYDQIEAEATARKP